MSSKNFFDDKKIAARFKHNILGPYSVIWATKTGLNATDNRVVILDGYAGQGRYDDGSEGSPIVLGNAARGLVGKRQVDLIFVEDDAKNFATLESLVAQELTDLNAVPYKGRVESHLDKVLEQATGVPLLAFLDPCGLGMTFNDIVGKVLARPNRIGMSTEVLLNFSAHGVKRIGGRLDNDYEVGKEKTLARMDAQCGGDWWREAYRSAGSPEAAAEAIAVEYMKLVNKAAHCGGWVVEVRNAPHHQPAYNLVFFSRHPDGLLTFGEVVSTAQGKWRQDVVEPGTLLDDPVTFKASEKELADGWIDRIAENLRKLFINHEVVWAVRMYDELYEGVIGDAREMHVRWAIKRLHAEKLSETTGVNWELKDPIKRA